MDTVSRLCIQSWNIIKCRCTLWLRSCAWCQSGCYKQYKAYYNEGFNHKLSVSNAEGSVSWSSSNSKVAAVSSTGLVKAKKNGSATITAKLSDGTKLTCTVSVKKNVYSKSKTPVSSVAYGKTGVDVYKVSYDKKGNLVMKANILNNSYHTDTKIKKLKLQLKHSVEKL